MPAVMAALIGSPLAERYEFEAIPTYRDSRPLARLVLFGASLLALVRWCARPGPRIAHVHMAARGSMYRKAVIVAVARSLRRPVILHLHAGPGDLTAFLDRLGRIRLALLRATLTAATSVLSVSAGTAEALSEALGLSGIEVVPNPPPATALAAPASGGSPRDGVGILYLGGFDDPAKGGRVLIESLPALLGASAEVHVVLAGPGGPPGALPERSQWSGWLDEGARDAAFAEADVFVMPSLSEGMPMALLEAMAHRLPIVASRVGGVPEMLTDGLDAVLVEPGDARQLACALADLAGDPERRRTLAAAAGERVRRLAEEDVYTRLDRAYLWALR